MKNGNITRQDVSPIIVAGSGRSGTTWVGDILASCEGCCPIFEPLRKASFPDCSPAIFGAANFPGRYLAADAVADRLKEFLGSILDGRISNCWTRQDWRIVPPLARDTRFLERLGYWYAKKHYQRRQRRSERSVVKVIRGNLLLSWLTRQFPLQVIYLTRHPCAVVGSRLRLNWDHGLQGVLGQADLMADYLSPYRDVIQTAQTPLQKMTVLWCVENLVPLTQLPEERWLTLSYEECLNDPGSVFDQLLSQLQMKASPSTRKALTTLVSSPSEASGRVRNWHEPLSEAEGREVLEICERFGIGLYGEQRMPLCDHREGIGKGAVPLTCARTGG